MTSGVQFYVRGIKIRITFGFFAVWAALIAQSPVSRAGEIALLCCLLHESGHIAAMALLGIKPRSLVFYSGGISMKSGGGLIGPVREIFILSAGCVINFIAAAVGAALGNRLLWGINLALGLFNLLPLPSLDGGRILSAIVGAISPGTDISGFQRIFGILAGICAAVFFFSRGSVSFTLPLSLGLIILEGGMFSCPSHFRKINGTD